MKIHELIPELLVENMPKSLDFYTNVLGFKTEILFPEVNPIFAQVGRDGVHVMLYDRSYFQKEIPKLKQLKMGGSVLLYLKARDIASFYQKIKERVTTVQAPHKTAYGTMEFTIEDCNGYFIAFSEALSGK